MARVSAGRAQAIALSRAVVARRARRRKKRLPQMLPPKAQQREFYARIKPRALAISRLAKERLIPALPAIYQQAQARRPDSETERLDRFYMDDVRAIINGMSVVFARLFPDDGLEADVGDIGNQVSDFNQRQLDRVVSSVAEVNVFRTEPWLEQELDSFSSEAVGYVKSIDDQYFGELSQMTARAVRSGQSYADLAADIQSRFNVADNRAKLVARDQVGKLNGQLTGLRQQDLGISQYVWRTLKDLRVRGNPQGMYPDAEPSHFARENEVFSWDDPPEGGHPGQAINCRCYAEPVIPGVEEPASESD